MIFSYTKFNVNKYNIQVWYCSLYTKRNASKTTIWILYIYDIMYFYYKKFIFNTLNNYLFIPLIRSGYNKIYFNCEKYGALWCGHTPLFDNRADW